MRWLLLVVYASVLIAGELLILSHRARTPDVKLAWHTAHPLVRNHRIEASDLMIDPALPSSARISVPDQASLLKRYIAGEPQSWPKDTPVTPDNTTELPHLTPPNGRVDYFVPLTGDTATARVLDAGTPVRLIYAADSSGAGLIDGIVAALLCDDDTYAKCSVVLELDANDAVGLKDPKSIRILLGRQKEGK